jgi:hypothetical protein
VKALVVVLLVVALLLCVGLALIAITGLTRQVRERGWKTRGFDTPGYLWGGQGRRKSASKDKPSSEPGPPR